MNICHKIADWFLKLLYPGTCVFCGKVSRTEICDACCSKVQYIEEPRCKKCGKPVRYAEQEYCQDCQKREMHYVQGKSLWIHKGAVLWSVYQFKYHNRRVHAKFYAKEMYRLYGKWIRDCKIEYIVPVPLHRKRKRKRGYNQAEVIAKYLSRCMKIPVKTNWIVRKKYTEPQKILGNKERKKNLKDAFAVTENAPFEKRILVIDDIYTTGSTINEIAVEFLEKRHNKVWFLTISIGQDF